MAICAKEFKKPFYVLTESYKFSRMYPLNQKDLPNNFKVSKIFKTLCGHITLFIILSLLHITYLNVLL